MDNSKVDFHYINILYDRVKSLEVGDGIQVDLHKIGAVEGSFTVSDFFKKRFQELSIKFERVNILTDRVGESQWIWMIYRKKGPPGITWTTLTV